VEAGAVEVEWQAVAGQQADGNGGYRDVAGADDGVDDRGVTGGTTENLGEKIFLQMERICLKREWL
jgi:hypothetical protein